MSPKVCPKICPNVCPRICKLNLSDSVSECFSGGVPVCVQRGSKDVAKDMFKYVFKGVS